MRRRGLEPMHDEAINVTPLVDVVMCLIIFFLTCTHLAKTEANDKVKVPRAQMGQVLPDQSERLVINVFPHAKDATPGGKADDANTEPDIFIHGKPVEMERLTSYLNNEKLNKQDLKVILRADEGLSYSRISPILRSCLDAGIQGIHFSTRQEDNGGGGG